MITVKADPKALANFQRDLTRLSRDLGSADGKAMRREMREGAKAAAEIVAAEGRANAPVGKKRTVIARDGTRVNINPGRLKKSIKPKVDLLKGRVAVVAGVPKAQRDQGSTATRYRRPYWAAWVEYGHDVGKSFIGFSGRVTRTGARLVKRQLAKTGRVQGRRYLGRAMDAKSREVLRELQRALDKVLGRYNRKFRR